MESYFVYILKREKNGKYYIGSTIDIDARVRYHNAGMQRSSKSRIPFVVGEYRDMLIKIRNTEAG